MTGLVPFNIRNTGLLSTGFEDFHNMLDDFFSDNWLPRRSLESDTFKINEEKKNYIHRESRFSSMSRSVYLADADSQDIKAKLENGVLSISVPRENKTVKTQKIEID